MPGPFRPTPYYSPIADLTRAVTYLLAPPADCVIVAVDGVSYYRHGHVYYRRLWHNDRWVYMEVAPPVRVAVTTVPPTPERVVVNGQVYYRDGTTYYTIPPTPAPVAATPTMAATSTTPAPAQPQYVATKPPIGALLKNLPSGATAVTSGSTTYFQANGVYYLPIRMGESTQYVVVDKPN